MTACLCRAVKCGARRHLQLARARGDADGRARHALFERVKELKGVYRLHAFAGLSSVARIGIYSSLALGAMLIGALVVLCLRIAKRRNLRRRRQTPDVDHPLGAPEPKHIGNGSKQEELVAETSATSSSRPGLRISKPEDIEVDKDERGNGVVLGSGTSGKVRSFCCLLGWMSGRRCYASRHMPHPGTTLNF